MLDVEMALDSFKTIFHSVLDSVAPVKEVKLKQKIEPWMNSDISQNVRYRDETLNKFRKTKDPDLYENIVNLGTLCREKLGYQRDYLTNKIKENVGNSKKLWDQLKKLGYSSKKKESNNVVLEIDGETCLTLKRWQIALINSLQLLLQTWLTNSLQVLIYFIQSPTFQKFYKGKNVQGGELMLIPVNEDFIYKELCKLNPSKSTGTDNVPARFVKDAVSVFKKTYWAYH